MRTFKETLVIDRAMDTFSQTSPLDSNLLEVMVAQEKELCARDGVSLEGLSALAKAANVQPAQHRLLVPQSHLSEIFSWRLLLPFKLSWLERSPLLPL